MMKMLAVSFVLFLALSQEVSAVMSQDLIADRGRGRDRPNLYDYNRENVEYNRRYLNNYNGTGDGYLRRGSNANYYYYSQPDAYYQYSPDFADDPNNYYYGN